MFYFFPSETTWTGNVKGGECGRGRKEDFGESCSRERLSVGGPGLKSREGRSRSVRLGSRGPLDADQTRRAINGETCVFYCRRAS